MVPSILMRLARFGRLVSVGLAASALFTGAARAATYRIPTDDALIGKAGVIVRGQVEERTSFRDADGGTSTDVTIRVERVLKGGPLPATIVVHQLGGVIHTDAGDEGDVYPGTGTLAPDERVLLMLSPRPGGGFKLTDFALGKFHVARAADGSELLRRDGLRGAFVLPPRSSDGARTGQTADPDRDAAAFERYVGSVLRGAYPRIEYERPPGPAASSDREAGFTWLGEVGACSGGTNSGGACTSNSDCPGGGHCPTFPPARRSEFDTGTRIVYKDNARGEKSVCVGGTNNGNSCSSDSDCPDHGQCHCPAGCHDEVANGVVKWNCAAGATILLDYGGTDSTMGSKCSGSLANQIQYNDPCGEIGNLSSCAGTLAVGGFSFSTSSGGAPACFAKGSPSFQKITKGRILLNNGLAPCLDSCDYTDMIAHETGHTIGAGHTDDPSALMYPQIHHGQCGALAPDDEAFAQCFYPQIPFQCALTATKTTGEYPLTVTFDAGVAGGPCPYTYSYDFGDGASDDSAAPTHVYATAGTRMVNLSVTDGDGSQCTGSVSITVQPCTAPTVATVTPRVTLSGVVKAIVTGTGFLKGATVQIYYGDQWVSAPISSRTSRTRIVGRDLAMYWPAGVTVSIRVQSATGCPSLPVLATR